MTMPFSGTKPLIMTKFQVIISFCSLRMSCEVQNNKDFTPEEVEAMPIPNEDKQLLKNSPALYYRSNNPVKDVFGGIAPQSQFNINFTGWGK